LSVFPLVTTCRVGISATYQPSLLVIFMPFILPH
jgi:hypothetical protein